MKYVWLFVYKISWRYLNILIQAYLKCHTLNSYNSTTNKNIHILITYYDIKYYVYMCTNFHKDFSIFGSSIFWKSMMKLYSYDDSHLKNHSPLKSECTGREHTQETTLLWKVIMWKQRNDPSPCVQNSKEKEVSTRASAFSSTQMQDGWKTGQWVPNTVNLLQW